MKKESAKKDFDKTKKKKPAKEEGGMSITDPKVRWNCRPGPRSRTGISPTVWRVHVVLASYV